MPHRLAVVHVDKLAGVHDYSADNDLCDLLVQKKKGIFGCGNTYDVVPVSGCLVEGLGERNVFGG